MAKAKTQETTQAAASTTPKGKRGRKPLPEDPREAFIQAVTGPTGRVQNVIQALETLSKVSSPRYDYDPEHIDAIEEVVSEALEECFTRLRTRPPAAVRGGGFSFE